MKEKKYLHHEIHADTNTIKGKIASSLREIVFGIQDGIVSTLGAVTGIAAGVQDAPIIVLSGIVVIVVESISMAAGTFLSSKSEREVQEKMLEEEAEEIENHPEAEKEELKVFYRERGFADEEITILVNRITSDKKLWLEEMAFKELKVIPQHLGTPKKDAIIMGISYVFGGLVPLSSYFFFSIHTALILSLLSSFSILFLVGYMKGKLLHGTPTRSGIEMVIVSLLAAGIGYLVGNFLGTRI